MKKFGKLILTAAAASAATYAVVKNKDKIQDKLKELKDTLESDDFDEDDEDFVDEDIFEEEDLDFIDDVQTNTTTFENTPFAQSDGAEVVDRIIELK